MMEPSDEALDRAARVLVHGVLQVARGERFVAVGDIDTASILATLERVAREAGAEVAALRLDQLRSHSTNHSGDRPHKVLPDGVRRAMLSAQASVFVASSLQLEASMRDQLQHIVAACEVRHAHLPGISPHGFSVGLAVEPARIADSASALMRLLEVGAEIRCTSDDGTDLVVHPGSHRWAARVGRVGRGESVTFPTGSLILAPETIRGTFAASASLGEFLDERERLLREPVLFDIADGCVTGIRCPGSPELVRELEKVVGGAQHSDRVGLVILGLNPGAPSATGSVAVDQHRPGLHLVIGDPQTKLTPVSWTARTSFAVCAAANSVQVDGVPVMQSGELLFS